MLGTNHNIAMADQLQHPQQTDPLGLQTFALSESAYDLMMSLIGLYTRLIQYESEQERPNTKRINDREKRVNQLHELYYQSDWTNLESMPELISTLTDEYKQISQQETECANAANTRTRAVLPY